MPRRMTTLTSHTKVSLLALLVLVATITRSYASDCGTDQMFLRGTFNAWSTASMSCENGHWSASGITFSDSSGGRYKFDVLGDWSENYGAGNGNRVAKSGPNIPISGPGTFRILFDYEGKTYEAIPEGNARPCGTPRMQVRGTFNNWDAEPMQCMEDGTWFIAGLAFEEGGRFKFDVRDDWAENYGDNPPADGVVEASGKSIRVPADAEYAIRFDYPGRKYSLSLSDPPRKQVTFKCKNSHTREGESVFVFGDIEALGQWSYEKALPLIPEPQDPLVWTATVTNVPVAGMVRWKCLKKGIEKVIQGGPSNKILPQDDDTLVAAGSFATPLEAIDIPNVATQDAEFEDLFSLDEIRSIFIEISEDEWNNLLNDIDRSVDRKSGIYRVADFYYGTDRSTAEEIPNVGFRIRGNSSRTRPEAGSPGSRHREQNSLVRAHFRIKFNEKFDDDESVYSGSDDIPEIPGNKGRLFRGLSAVNLKFNKDDRTYLREPVAYDLFKRFGVETARTAYVKLHLEIGDDPMRYMGLYFLGEPIDKRWVERRFDDGKASFLFKSLHKRVGPADLSRADEDPGSSGGLIGIDRIDPPAPGMTWGKSNIYQPAYNLKTKKKKFPEAQDLLNDFIRDLNSASTKEDLEQILDVPALLRAQAVSIYLGMWDDYWQNANNYYLYRRRSDNRWLFIPYDYDRAFTRACERASFHDWGEGACYKDLPSIRPVLIEKVLAIAELRDLYRNYIRLLASDQHDFAHWKAMEPRFTKIKHMTEPAIRGYDAKDKYPYNPDIRGLRSFVQQRSRQVGAEIGEGDIVE